MTRRCNAIVAFIPIVALISLLFATINAFGSDSLSGGSQIALLTATAVAIAIGIFYLKMRWSSFEQAIIEGISKLSTAIIMLLMIGALSGSWMVSGVVPTFIYYGVKLIHPDLFLVTTCIICALVSLMTGSSWTTVATIGIALMGIGRAQGFSEGWIAGAIISGAYFGDKMSPLSDTTVLASSVAGTPLFTHIRYMLITTIPSLIVTLIIFTIAGFSLEVADTEHIKQFSTALSEKFTITPWLLITPIVTVILILKKIPAVITLFLSAILGGVSALIFQPDLLAEVAGVTSYSEWGTLFKGFMATLFGSTNLQTNSAAVTELIATRGMAGMLNTVWLILCASCFGASMTITGMLSSITALFIRFMKNRVGTVASTVLSGLFMNLTTADQYISIILTGNMFRDVYEENGYEPRLLSRSTEDSVTVTSVLIPWNTCGMTQSTVLNVSTLTYLPYCFFNIISPIMSILVSITGYKIVKRARGTLVKP